MCDAKVALVCLVLSFIPASTVSGAETEAPAWSPRDFTPRSENDPGVEKGAGHVRWRPWVDGFAEAAKSGKPILLFVTAPWCHAGHIMERTTFTDPGINTLIDQGFIPIKLNRDERPDIDIRLQQAVQAISGVRGWPLTVCLTPTGKVFFGGTSFTADDDFQTEKTGLRTTLRWVAELWQQARPKAYERGDALDELFKKALDADKLSGKVSPDALKQLATGMATTLDERSGGSKLEPSRFPAPRGLDACLLDYARSGNAASLKVVTITLDAMLRGAIYDRLGGGFHRYCLDRWWRQPRFEKMLTLNAEMLPVLLHAWQATGNVAYKEAIERTMRCWNSPPLWNDRGGVAGWSGSMAADINSVDEGDYFTWTVKEIERALPDDADVRLACAFYGIGESGDLPQTAPSRNVLYEAMPLADAAKKSGLDEADARKRLARILDQLVKARNARPAPIVDENIYVDANALMAAASLECGRALDHREWIDAGARVLKGILANSIQPGVNSTRMKHVLTGKRDAGSPALSSGDSATGLAADEAAVFYACAIALEVTGDPYFKEQAEASFRRINENFWDPVNGGNFDRIPGANAEPESLLPWNEKPYMDAAEPPLNGLIAQGCVRMFALTGDESYRDRGTAIVEAFAAPLPKLGPYAATLTSAADALQNGVTRVTISGEAKSAPVRELLETAATACAPWKVVMVKNEANNNHALHIEVLTNSGKSEPATAAELKKVLTVSGKGQ
jgi:uncharacterized protein YyaL (SSP411 family)